MEWRTDLSRVQDGVRLTLTRTKGDGLTYREHREMASGWPERVLIHYRLAKRRADLTADVNGVELIRTPVTKPSLGFVWTRKTKVVLGQMNSRIQRLIVQRQGERLPKRISFRQKGWPFEDWMDKHFYRWVSKLRADLTASSNNRQVV